MFIVKAGVQLKITHTGIEIDPCAFQTGCRLPSATLDISLEFCGLGQFMCHETNVLLCVCVCVCVCVCGGGGGGGGGGSV